MRMRVSGLGFFRLLAISTWAIVGRVLGLGSPGPDRGRGPQLFDRSSVLRGRSPGWFALFVSSLGRFGGTGCCGAIQVFFPERLAIIGRRQSAAREPGSGPLGARFRPVDRPR